MGDKGWGYDVDSCIGCEEEILRQEILPQGTNLREANATDTRPITGFIHASRCEDTKDGFVYKMRDMGLAYFWTRA